MHPVPVVLSFATNPLEFIMAVLNIGLINIILAGDNAVVIALAVQALPRPQRLLGMLIGAGLAVVLRVVLTFGAAQLLLIPFLKLIGGALILWIAVKLLVQGDEAAHGKRTNTSLWSAIWMILVADITMSVDNVLAVAAAAHSSMPLLIFGLGLSIPVVVFASNILSQWMEKFPVIILIGAAVLGRVGAALVLEDPFVHRHMPLPVWGHWAIELLCAGAVVAVGVGLARAHARRNASRAEEPVTPLPEI